MENKYVKLSSPLGESLDSVVKNLLEYNYLGQYACIDFNGHTLYSDVDTMDTAYMKIVGMSKSDYDTLEQKRHQEYQDAKRNHEESIHELKGEWITKGKEILDEKYHTLWEQCVPIRLNDMYQGMELGATLDIVKELNSGCDLETAEIIIDEQGHSGMSFGLVCSMVKSFCDRGDSFVKYVNQD